MNADLDCHSVEHLPTVQPHRQRAICLPLSHRPLQCRTLGSNESWRDGRVRCARLRTGIKAAMSPWPLACKLGVADFRLVSAAAWLIKRSAATSFKWSTETERTASLAFLGAAASTSVASRPKWRCGEAVQVVEETRRAHP